MPNEPLVFGDLLQNSGQSLMLVEKLDSTLPLVRCNSTDDLATQLFSLPTKKAKINGSCNGAL